MMENKGIFGRKSRYGNQQGTRTRNTTPERARHAQPVHAGTARYPYRRCEHCGRLVPARTMFCPICGTPAPIAASEERAS